MIFMGNLQINVFGDTYNIILSTLACSLPLYFIIHQLSYNRISHLKPIPKADIIDCHQLKHIQFRAARGRVRGSAVSMPGTCHLAGDGCILNLSLLIIPLFAVLRPAEVQLLLKGIRHKLYLLFLLVLKRFPNRYISHPGWALGRYALPRVQDYGCT